MKDAKKRQLLGQSSGQATRPASRFTRPFPLWALTAAVVLTLACFVFAGWRSWEAYSAFTAIATKDMRLQRLVGTIVHLDEVLTMSARMAASTGDARWEERYLIFEPRLDAAIKEALDLVPGAYESGAAAQTDAANKRLVEREMRAFKLVREGQRSAAAEVLFSPEYEKQKHIYASGMQALTVAMEKNVRAELDLRHAQVRLVGLTATLGTVVLLFAWIGLLALTRSHVTRRKEAEREIQQLNADLERRVAQRSAELQATVERLDAELVERGRIEMELRCSEERFALAIDAVNECIRDWDLRTNEVYFSPQWRQLLGVTDEKVEVDPAEWYRRMHPNDFDLVIENIWRHLEGLTAAYDVEYRLRHEDGSYRWVRSRGKALRDAAGKPYRLVGSVTDVTARRRAQDEAQRRQAELAHVLRVATLGEMAVELTHEMNQPLGAIVNFAKGLAVRLQDGVTTREAMRDAAEQIAAEALRAAAVIQRVRDFVRKGEIAQQPSDINGLVRRAADLMELEARYHTIPVRLALGSGLPSVDIDRVQVEQVVVNLLRNGIDAMPGGDNSSNELLVETRLGENSAVEVAIRDTGVGLPDGDENKIFEAFFTTKKDGLGMGLSISRSIIEAHGGRLWAVRNRDRGATFCFTLPCPD